MSNSDFASKHLKLEDVIISDLQTTSTEAHVFFSLKRKPHSCPHCGSITESVHDYRTSILKDLPFMGKTPSSIIGKDVITALVTINIFMNLSLCSLNIVASLPSLPFMLSTY